MAQVANGTKQARGGNYRGCILWTVHTDVLLSSPKAQSKAVNKRSEIGDTGSEAQTKASEKR
ncbi:hypothetical protein F2Q68_00035181 [Brassica cretica]|nr:hypothetical protein F2Q68_00035181 [Brassica cretica]